MAKVASTTQQDVQQSVTSIYVELLNKRNQERAEREAEKARLKEEKRLAKEQAEAEGKKMTKKEKRQAEMDNWASIVVGLTGEDFEYTSDRKPKKKKYRKWIDDDAPVMDKKPKKKKKRNYRKEFEPELNMLRTIVADQNRFTTDLQKRFQNAAGPATKDAMPLNKTLVELAATLNASRQNSLGYINAISGIKKTVAELYFKQVREDREKSGGGSEGGPRDLQVEGSEIGAAMSLRNPYLMAANNPTGPVVGTDITAAAQVAQTTLVPTETQDTSTPPTVTVRPLPDDPLAAIPDFDASTWDGAGAAVNPETEFEAVPHQYVVERNRSTGAVRFKAVRLDSGEELVGCPVPQMDMTKLSFNDETGTVKGQFGENYSVQDVD